MIATFLCQWEKVDGKTLYNVMSRESGKDQSHSRCSKAPVASYRGGQLWQGTGGAAERQHEPCGIEKMSGLNSDITSCPSYLPHFLYQLDSFLMNCKDTRRVCTSFRISACLACPSRKKVTTMLKQSTPQRLGYVKAAEAAKGDAIRKERKTKMLFYPGFFASAKAVGWLSFMHACFLAREK